MKKIKVKILKFIELKTYGLKKVQIVYINLKNSLGNFRKLEIGFKTIIDLDLSINEEIIIYENPNKNGDFKIDYEETYNLYGIKFKEYKFIRRNGKIVERSFK